MFTFKVCLFVWDGDAAVPMVEAMVALVILDQLMAQHAQCNLFPINPDLQEPLFLPRLDDGVAEHEHEHDDLVVG
jgi:hypothetical protein